MNNTLKAYLTAYHSEVTGSRLYLVIERPDGETYRILVDYGYFQEPSYRYLNYVQDLNPEKIDAIILTHNHIDHSGLIPYAVKNGYRNNVYMTEITRELVNGFWNDCAQQQETNAAEMREKYPFEAHKFNALYHAEDVNRALKHCVGVPYRKTIEILPGVKLTFWENGHLLGASMVLLQCSYPNMKPLNYLFTGDIRLTNCFYNVPEFPEWFKNMELIMVCESTYGSTRQEDIKYCFKNNILEAFKKKQNILIGAFAQGRMQEMLYEFRGMEEEGLIPDDYEIYIDGPLGIETTFKYQKILSWFNPEKSDFIPKRLQIVEGQAREKILSDGVPKIIITTSGMLSNGPACTYVPIFLVHNNALIHLVGYAAEETLARKLLESKRDEEILIGGHYYKKNAVVKTTREKTSHATEDQLMEFINLFTNVRFIAINHGNTEVKKVFANDIVNECPNVNEVGILDREHMCCFYRVGHKKDFTSQNIIVKTMPAGLINDSKVVFGKEADKEFIKMKKLNNSNKKKSKKQKKGKKSKGPHKRDFRGFKRH